jgi:hypothetical protein
VGLAFGVRRGFGWAVLAAGLAGGHMTRLWLRGALLRRRRVLLGGLTLGNGERRERDEREREERGAEHGWLSMVKTRGLHQQVHDRLRPPFNAHSAGDTHR